MEEIKERLKLSIASGYLEAVLKELRSICQNTDLYNSSISLSGRLHAMQRHKINGTLSGTELELIENNIREPALELIDKALPVSI